MNHLFQIECLPSTVFTSASVRSHQLLQCLVYIYGGQGQLVFRHEPIGVRIPQRTHGLA